VTTCTLRRVLHSAACMQVVYIFLHLRLLFAGEKGVGKSGKPLHYKACKFHRVIPQFMLQVRFLPR
jgi:cyclophilin family peptidyl-prolyl cis-trans isomerase